MKVFLWAGICVVTFLSVALFFSPARNVTIANGEPQTPDTLGELTEALNSFASSSFPVSSSATSFCASDTDFFDPGDSAFCARPPKMQSFRLFEIDLSDDRIFFYENGLLKKTFPVAYQAPYGVWFQTPTGYFQIGAKRDSFMSSIFPVYMDNAVQLYEDFFIHGIPYHTDGTKVTSQFSGGCIRLEDDVAEDFYHLIERGDIVVSYTTLNGLVPKNGFSSPVAQNDVWIRQRFNSPLKTDWRWYEDKRENYIQHAGIDFAPNPSAQDLGAYAIAPGRIVAMVENGDQDRGLGNTLIVRHVVDGTVWYALYGHLSMFEPGLKIGDEVLAGGRVGTMGSTGYGCNYWHIGNDGCASREPADIHLHFEIKSKPVLEAPIDDTCVLNNQQGGCVGYTSDNPWEKGFKDPLQFVFQEQN